MSHNEIMLEIALLREWKIKATAIPTEQTGRHSRNEWVQDWTTSDDGGGHFTTVDFATITRYALAEFVKMDQHPKSIGYIISMCDETPVGGFINFSKILQMVERKIELLQEEIELTGKFRIDFYHESYQFAEPKYQEIFSAADFRNWIELHRNNLAIARAGSTTKEGSWWITFSKWEEGEGRYNETLHLFKQRIKL